MTSFSLKIIRAVFGAMEPVMPRLAGRFAFALFQRTPDPSGVSEREKRLIAQVRRQFEYEARRHCLTTPGGRVTAYEFGAGRRRTAPAVLVIHGWGSRSEHMFPIIGGLLAEGNRVVALDLPGHGASEGRRLNMATAVAAVGETFQWLGPFHAIVGHSFGGAVALNALSGSIRGVPSMEAARLVMIAAPGSVPALFEDFGRFLALGPRTQFVLAERVHELTGRPLSEFEGAGQLSRLGVRTLVVHAPDDKEVPFSQALALAGAGPHVGLHVAKGLGHRRILADRCVAEVIARFVAAEEAGLDRTALVGRRRQDLADPVDHVSVRIATSQA